MTTMNKLTKKQQLMIYEAFRDLIDLYEMLHNDAHRTLMRSGYPGVLWNTMQSTYRLDKMNQYLDKIGIELKIDDSMVIASSSNYVQNEALYRAIKEAYQYKVEY